MTRLFLHGRTETVRPATMQSVAFVNAMVDPTVTVRRMRLLRARARAGSSGLLDRTAGRD